MAETLPAARRCVLVCFLLFAPAAPALAQGSPPPPLPPPPLPGEAAVDQYREALPNAAGSVAPVPGSKRSTPLPAPAQARLAAEAGTDAPLLREVATSSDYGAPQTRVRGPREREEAGRPDRGGAPSPPLPAHSLARGLGAAADAARDGAGARLVVVLAAMLAIGAGLAVAARRASA